MPVPTAVPPTGNSSSASTAVAGPVDRQLQLPGQAADLLAERQRRGVGQMRAADLENLLPRGGLFAPAPRRIVQGGDEPLVDRHGRGHVNRRGKHVVRALAHVDVVVGMDRLLGAKRSPPASSIARLAITSLAFMLLDVPEPV